MKKILDQKLCKKYPEIFKDRFADMSTTAMCWGFECDDGWYGIIDTLCHEIMHASEEDIPVATQVKEKYGTLRFYINAGNEAVNNAIDLAEKKSAETCEVCGLAGVLRDKNSWLKTLCDDDAKKLKYAEVV